MWLHSLSTSSGSLVLNPVGAHVNRALKCQEKSKDLCSYSSFCLPALAPLGITTLWLWGSVTGEFVGIKHDRRVESSNHTLKRVYPTFLQHSHSSPSSVPLPVWLLFLLIFFAVTWLIRSLPCQSLFILALSNHFTFSTTDTKPRARAKMRRKGS